MMKKDIPLLTAADIDVRVQQIKQNRQGKVTAGLLLYKNARVDMRILDEVFGTMGWQRTHEVINGNLFCSIDLWDEEKHEWVRKQDVGVESNTEKEKGEASDSFKRAGTNVGIGRELYSAPRISVTLDQGEYSESNGRFQCWETFHVADIGYNERREICRLEIADAHNTKRYTFGEQKPEMKKAPKPEKKTESKEEPKEAPKPAAMKFTCEECGAELKPYRDANGNPIGVKQHMEGTMDRFGRVLCLACAMKQKKEA